MKRITTLLSAALLAGLPLAAMAETPPDTWNVQVIAKSAAGPLEFVQSVPDGGCSTSELKGSTGTTGALKICMGNTPAPHTLYGWLVTDPIEAAKAGEKKFESAEHFSLGSVASAAQMKTSLYSVLMTRAVGK